jgi:phage shock protein PspC (stress-responsive transcriptional regulator)
MEMKRCPYCAEEIRAEATRCRYCRSRLASFQMERWHRSHPDARFAGVCAALARALSLPVTGVRVGFVLATVLLPVHILAPLAYAVLVLLIPKDAGSESLLEQWLRWGLAIASRFSGRTNGSSGPPSVMPS